MSTKGCVPKIQVFPSLSKSFQLGFTTDWITWHHQPFKALVARISKAQERPLHLLAIQTEYANVLQGNKLNLSKSGLCLCACWGGGALPGSLLKSQQRELEKLGGGKSCIKHH